MSTDHEEPQYAILSISLFLPTFLVCGRSNVHFKFPLWNEGFPFHYKRIHIYCDNVFPLIHKRLGPLPCETLTPIFTIFKNHIT